MKTASSNIPPNSNVTPDHVLIVDRLYTGNPGCGFIAYQANIYDIFKYVWNVWNVFKKS